MAAEPSNNAVVLKNGAMFVDRTGRSFLLAVPPGYLHPHTFNDPDQLRKLASNSWSNCHSVEINSAGYHVVRVDMDPAVTHELAYTVGANILGYRKGKDAFHIVPEDMPGRHHFGYNPSAAGVTFHFNSKDAASLVKRAVRLLNPLMHVESFASEEVVRVLSVFRRVPSHIKNDVLVEQNRPLVEPALVRAVEFASKIESAAVMRVFKVTK